MEKIELAGKIRYVKLIVLINAIRKSQRHLKLLSRLRIEAHGLRERHGISHDVETFERLRSDLPAMKARLAGIKAEVKETERDKETGKTA